MRLTGFGLARDLEADSRSHVPSETVTGTYAYMPPEQTGRTNQPVDARSDPLFARGRPLRVVYRRASLRGRRADRVDTLPSRAAACQAYPPTELVAARRRADIAQTPVQGSRWKVQKRDRTGGRPQALSRILDIRRHHRRFSACDLRCIGPTVLGKKVYGREREFDDILVVARRMMSTGDKQVVLLSGAAGIGKSSIVSEARKALIRDGTLFSSGKFDQYKNDIPYATIADIFRVLIRQLLTKGDADLQGWRRRLSDALGPNGQLMLNIIPELEVVIGAQPPTSLLDPQAAQSRFHLTFVNMVSVFARPEHPLVLFVDDLQWVDAGTLALLTEIATQPQVQHLMLICAYRDDEIDESDPLSKTLAALRETFEPVHELELAPLKLHQVSEMIADALGSDSARTMHLAQLMLEKTAGNPFFTIQFLTNLLDDGLIAFRPRSASWEWDTDQIRSKGITDNVGQMMTFRLRKMSRRTQRALAQLACLGSAADVPILCHALGKAEDEVRPLVAEAAKAGLVVREGTASPSPTTESARQRIRSFVRRKGRPATCISAGRSCSPSAQSRGARGSSRS